MKYCMYMLVLAVNLRILFNDRENDPYVSYTLYFYSIIKMIENICYIFYSIKTYLISHFKNYL